MGTMRRVSLSAKVEESPASPKKVELKAREYTPEALAEEWGHLRKLLASRIPILSAAMEQSRIEAVDPTHAKVHFSAQGGVNAFESFQPRAENFFKQVFNVPEFRIEGLLDPEVAAKRAEREALEKALRKEEEEFLKNPLVARLVDHFGLEIVHSKPPLPLATEESATPASTPSIPPANNPEAADSDSGDIDSGDPEEDED